MDDHLVLPTGVEEYCRVPVNEDKDWITDFVPWLEALEEKGVGVEDGFLVATFSNSIKIINEETESDFLKTCGKGLGPIVIQKLQQFHNAKTMHYGVNTLQDEGMLKKFNDETVDIRQYKKETCCSKILKDRGITQLMAHLDSYMHSRKKQVHSAKIGGWASSSRVVIEEQGEQLKKNYSKFKNDASNFKWNQQKKEPPKLCPEAECGLNSDTQESSSDDEDVGDSIQPKLKQICQTDVTLYGFGSSDEFQGELKVTDKFCMSKVFNLLWLLPNLLPGFHSSYIFYGTTHSHFPVHVEDALTLSMNYLFIGHPKLWVMIPPWATSLLEFHLKRCGSFLSVMHCSNFMGHKSLLPTVRALLEFNIPFKLVVQHPGDLVVLYPNTAHFGFNLGRNVAEAVNFAIPSWIPWGAMAPKCSCLSKQIHIPMKPFLVAFRPELLDDIENGRAITTPAFVRGMQLLAKEIERIGKGHSVTLKKEDIIQTGSYTRQGNSKENSSVKQSEPKKSDCLMGEGMKKCPLPKCQNYSNSLKAMIRHVKSAHHPLLLNQKFMKSIDVLYRVP